MQNFLSKAKAVYGTFSGEVLGHLLWYSIPGGNIPKSHLEQAFAQAGLDKNYLPRPIYPQDAFRRACRIKARYNLNGLRWVNYFTREVANNSKDIVFHIVREIVDSGNVRLEYTPILEVKFKDSDPDNLEFLELAHDITRRERAFAQEILKRYQDCRTCYPSETVRRVAHNVLKSCSLVGVRPSGGVYFVPQQHEIIVFTLKAFFEHLEGAGHRGVFWFLPVIDAQNQREMVSSSLDDTVEAEAASIIKDLARALKPGYVPSAEFVQRYMERFRALDEKVTEYEQLLETKAITARSHIDLARQQIQQMLAGEGLKQPDAANLGARTEGLHQQQQEQEVINF